MNDKKEVLCPKCKNKTIDWNKRLDAMTGIITCEECGAKLYSKGDVPIIFGVIAIIVMILKFGFGLNNDNLWMLFFLVPFVTATFVLVLNFVPLSEYKSLKLRNKKDK